MLNLLGSPRRLCNGLSRRDFLRLGAVGTLGLGQWLAQADGASPSGTLRFGRAKACIFATVFPLLGIDPHTTVHDTLGRPVSIAGSGVVRADLLA